MERSVTLVAAAASKARGPFSYAAIVVTALVAIAALGFTTPSGILITSIAVPLVVFSRIHWIKLIDALPLVAGVILLMLATTPFVGIYAAWSMSNAAGQGLESYSSNFGRAQVHFDNEQYRDAIQELREVPPDNPQYSHAQSMIGLNQFRLGNLDESLHHYTIAMNTASSAREKASHEYSIARVRLAADDFSGAAEILRELVHKPENASKPRYLLNLAVAEHALGRTAEARRLLSRFDFTGSPSPSSSSGRDVFAKAQLLHAQLTWEEQKQDGCDTIREYVAKSLELSNGATDPLLYGGEFLVPCEIGKS